MNFRKYITCWDRLKASTRQEERKKKVQTLSQQALFQLVHSTQKQKKGNFHSPWKFLPIPKHNSRWWHYQRVCLTCFVFIGFLPIPKHNSRWWHYQRVCLTCFVFIGSAADKDGDTQKAKHLPGFWPIEDAFNLELKKAMVKPAGCVGVAEVNFEATPDQNYFTVHSRCIKCREEPPTMGQR